MASRRDALLDNHAADLASPVESPQWHELLTRVEVLLATLREQITETDAREAPLRRRDRAGAVRQHLIEDIDAARSAVKDARRRVAGSVHAPSVRSRGRLAPADRGG